LPGESLIEKADHPPDIGGRVRQAEEGFGPRLKLSTATVSKVGQINDAFDLAGKRFSSWSQQRRIAHRTTPNQVCLRTDLLLRSMASLGVPSP
jgi:hypothetical protein